MGSKSSSLFIFELKYEYFYSDTREHDKFEMHVKNEIYVVKCK